MLFDEYKKHKDARLRPSLLWEYEQEGFEWDAMRTVVVQRVVERGLVSDFYFILNRYGLKGVKDAIKDIPYLNAKDRNFVCVTFNLKPEELKCYTHRQSIQKHWNS